ncbi:MAG: ATP-binding cassette domain-containing protein [Bacilli bacterium]
MEMIELKNITKCYGNHKILDNINYIFQAGKVYLITGENGSGKSTLIKSILKLIRLTNGEITVNTNQIGYVPEHIIFPEFVQVFPFLQKLALIKKIDPFVVTDVVDFFLDFWGLYPNKRSFLKSLSKGMMQKIMIIQAFFGDPKLLVFDEPLNGLDEYSQMRFFKLIKEEKSRNKTILISTHYANYYRDFCDNFLKMNQGGINEEHFKLSF